MPRTYLFVPRRDEATAKELGARWDARRKHWYVPAGVDLAPFAKWNRDLWLTLKQRHFANELCDLFRYDIPLDILYEKKFGCRFLELFKYDPDNIFFPTGVKRINIIKTYIEEDAYIDHLKTKFDVPSEDIAFMIDVMTRYGGDIKRDDGKQFDVNDDPIND